MGEDLQTIYPLRGYHQNTQRTNATQNQKTNNFIKNWKQKLKRYFPKEDIQMVNRLVKRCSMSLIIKKCKAKTHNKTPPHTCPNGDHQKD